MQVKETKTCVVCSKTKTGTTWLKGPKCSACYAREQELVTQKCTECRIEKTQRGFSAKGKCRGCYLQEYRRNNPEQKIVARNYRRNYFKTDKGKYVESKSSAKQRGQAWELTENQYNEIHKLPCFYCSGPLPKSGGLDRIDNSKGYLPDNVIPACTNCNKLRNEYLTVLETKQVINLLQTLRQTNDIWQSHRNRKK